MHLMVKVRVQNPIQVPGTCLVIFPTNRLGIGAAWCVPQTARGHTIGGHFREHLPGIAVSGAMHLMVKVRVQIPIQVPGTCLVIFPTNRVGGPVQVPCTFIAGMLIFRINRLVWRCGVVCPRDGPGTHRRRSSQAALAWKSAISAE